MSVLYFFSLCFRLLPRKIYETDKNTLGSNRIQIIVFFIFRHVVSVNRQIFGDYFEMCQSLSFWTSALWIIFYLSKSYPIQNNFGHSALADFQTLIQSFQILDKSLKNLNLVCYREKVYIRGFVTISPV